MGRRGRGEAEGGGERIDPYYKSEMALRTADNSPSLGRPEASGRSNGNGERVCRRDANWHLLSRHICPGRG